MSEGIGVGQVGAQGSPHALVLLLGEEEGGVVGAGQALGGGINTGVAGGQTGLADLVEGDGARGAVLHAGVDEQVEGLAGCAVGQGEGAQLAVALAGSGHPRDVEVAVGSGQQAVAIE